MRDTDAGVLAVSPKRQYSFPSSPLRSSRKYYFGRSSVRAELKLQYERYGNEIEEFAQDYLKDVEGVFAASRLHMAGNKHFPSSKTNQSLMMSSGSRGGSSPLLQDFITFGSVINSAGKSNDASGLPSLLCVYGPNIATISRAA